MDFSTEIFQSRFNFVSQFTVLVYILCDASESIFKNPREEILVLGQIFNVLVLLRE